MRQNFLRLIGAAWLISLILTVPLLAADLPSRKAGLWQIKTTIDDNSKAARVIKQCIDATTDQMMQSSAGPFDPAVCPRRDLQTSDNSITIDSVCTVGGKAATVHAVVTGSFDNAYKMTVISRSEEIPGGKMTMMMEGKWLGLCAADQKPGDIVLDNGVKINLPEMQKLGSSPATSAVPR